MEGLYSLRRCNNRAKVRTQTCFRGSWRDGLLLSRWHSYRGRRLQIQRHDALLQGPGSRERALGSKIHPEIQGRACKGILRRACADKEAEEGVDAQGRQTQLPLPRSEVLRSIAFGSWFGQGEFIWSARSWWSGCIIQIELHTLVATYSSHTKI